MKRATVLATVLGVVAVLLVLFIFRERTHDVSDHRAHVVTHSESNEAPSVDSAGSVKTPAEVVASAFREATRTSRIIVFDAEDRPISGALILASATKFRITPGPECRILGETGIDGSLDYTFARWPEELPVLSAHHHDFVSAAAERPTTECDIPIRMEKGHELVFDCRSRGAPLEGVVVRLSRSALGNGDSGVWPEVPPALERVHGVSGRRAVRGAVSDASGRAVIRCVRPGSYVVHGWKANFACVAPDEPIVVPTNGPIVVEMTEPTIYALEFDGNDVLSTRFAQPAGSGFYPRALFEAGASVQPIKSAFPKAFVLAWPSKAIKPTPLRLTIVHARGVNEVSIPGVPQSKFTKPEQEQFSPSKRFAGLGTASVEFMAPSGAASPLDQFALQFKLGDDSIRKPMSTPWVAMEPKLIASPLPPGEYRVIPIASDSRLFEPTPFNVTDGNHTRVRVLVRSDVRCVKVELGGSAGVGASGVMQVKSTLDGSHRLTQFPSTFWATVGSEMTLEVTAYGCEPTEMRVKVTDERGPLAVIVPIVERP